MDTSDCQIADLVRSSKKYPRLLTRLYQLRCNLQAHGLLGTSRKMWSKFVRDEVATDPRRVARSIETCSASEVLG
ncbi:MAG: hypothetical protein WBW77_00030, partial [Candidatus Sulfotelmatobacter sp.]